MYFCIIDTKYKLLLYGVVKLQKVWNIFLKFLGEVKPLVIKNNLRIILCSKSEKCKSIEGREYLGIFIREV